LQVLAAMPAAVPGLVLGLAYIMTFNSLSSPLNFLYGTATLIIIVNFYHYHTQAFLTLQTGFRQFPETLEEAGSSLGANLGRLSRDVVAPFMAPMLISVLLFLFMRSMVTISAVVFLSTPSVSVASFQILRLDDSGRTSQAAAFSTALMGVVILALIILTLLNRLVAKRHAA
jgi:iron(III) transport system permease protein